MEKRMNGGVHLLKWERSSISMGGSELLRVKLVQRPLFVVVAFFLFVFGVVLTSRGQIYTVLNTPWEGACYSTGQAVVVEFIANYNDSWGGSPVTGYVGYGSVTNDDGWTWFSASRTNQSGNDAYWGGEMTLPSTTGRYYFAGYMHVEGWGVGAKYYADSNGWRNAENNILQANYQVEALAYPKGVTVEHFGYSSLSSTGLAGKALGSGWTNAWAPDTNGWVCGGSFNSLSGFPENRGNKLYMNPNDPYAGQYGYYAVRRGFAPISTGLVYFSVFMNYQWGTENGKWAGISLMSNGQERAYVGAKGVSNKTGVLNLVVDGGTAVAGAYELENGAGKDYLVIGRYDFDTRELAAKAYWAGSSSPDAVPASEPETWDVSTTLAAGRIERVDGIRLGAGNDNWNTPGAIFFDEVRVATNWDSLVESSGPDPSDEPIWDGGAGASDMKFSTDGNWDSSRPAAAAQLSFAGTTSLFPTNDYPEGSQFSSIWFTNTSSSFTLRGNGCHVRTKIENQSVAAQTNDMIITFNGPGYAEVNPVNEDLTLNGDVYLETNLTLHVWGDGGHTLTFNGELREGVGSTAGAGLWLRQNSTVVLNEANTYTGATTLSSGTLWLGTDDAIHNRSALYVTNPAVFDVDAYETQVASISGNGEIDLGTGALRIAGGETKTFSGEISGEGKLIHNGSGTLVLSGANTYSGGTVVSGGIVRVSGDGNLGAVPDSATENLTVGNWAILDFSASMILNAKRSLTLGDGHLSVAEGATVDYAGIISGTGRFNKAGMGRLNLYGANTYNGDTSIQQGSLAIGSDGNLGQAPSGVDDDALQFENNDYNALYITNTMTLDSDRGIFLHTRGKMDVADGCTLTYGGIIKGNATNSLVKSGSGTLLLGGNNEFGENLFLDAGTLVLTGSDPLDAGWLDVGDNYSAESPPVTLRVGDGVTVDSQIHIRTNTNDSSTGPRIIAMDTVGAASFSAGIRLSDKLVISNVTGSTITFTDALWQTEGQVVAVEKKGPGRLVLDGANSFSENLYVNGGEVYVTAPDPLGVAWIDIGDSVAPESPAAQLALAPGVTLDNDIHIRTNANDSSTGARTLGLYPDGTAEISGGIWLSDTLEIGVWTDAVLTCSADIVQNGDFDRVVKKWPGTVRFSSADNTFKYLTIDEGIAQSGMADVLPTYHEMHIAAGAVYDLNDFNLTIQAFTGAGIMDLGTATLSVNMGYGVASDVRITGAGGLTKTGAGTEEYFELRGSSDYTGLTRIDQGQLKIHAATNIGSGNLAVASGATLWAADTLTLDSGRSVALSAGVAPSYFTVDAPGVMTVAGVVSGGKLGKKGAGTLTLTAENTYAGDTYILNGTLKLNNTGGDTLAGSSVIYIGELTGDDTSVLEIGAGVTVTNRIESREKSSGAGTNVVSKTGDGDATVSGPLDLFYGTTANNTFKVSEAGSGQLTFTSGWNLGGTQRVAVVEGDVKVTGGGITNGTPAAGWDGLVKRGTGTLLIDGVLRVNTYLDEGSVVIGSNCTFEGVDTFYLGTRDNENYTDADAMLTFQEAQTFTNGIVVGTLGADTGRRLIIFENTNGTVEISGDLVLGTNLQRYLVLSNDAAQAILSGDISGNGGLIKQGAGTIIFSAQATYADITRVEEGTLQLQSITNSASMIISNGAVLTGQGSVGTITNFGTIGPALNGAPGALACTGLRFGDGSSFKCAIDAGGNDLIEVDGDVTFDGSVTLNITNFGDGSLFRDRTLIDYGDGDSSIGSPGWVITGDVPEAMAPFMTVTNDRGSYWYLKAANPDCNITGAVPAVSEDLNIELQVSAVDGLQYDLIYIDAINYSDSLSNNWQLLYSDTAASDTMVFTNNLISLNVGFLRFLRVSPLGAWSNAGGKYASRQVYVGKRTRLYPGRNWVAPPALPVSPTVSNVFGYDLPAGDLAAGTRVYLYDKGVTIAPTGSFRLASGTPDNWVWETGGSGDADQFIMPVNQGFMIDLPGAAVREFALVGALRTNTQNTVIAGDDALTFVSVQLPATMHPKDLGLVDSGFTGGTRAMRSDRIYLWDRERQRIKDGRWLWYNSGNSTWYYDDGSPVSTVSRPVGQDDALLIYTAPGHSGYTWDNTIYYTPPNASMTP